MRVPTVIFLSICVILLIGVTSGKEADSEIDQLFKLNKIYELGLITEDEFVEKKSHLVDSYLGLQGSSKLSSAKLHERRRVKASSAGGEWVMDKIFTPQVKWLLSIFADSMPKSYDDVLPATGKSFWLTEKYLSGGPIDPVTGAVLPFDDDVSIQERSLTHVGLNIYDGGVWSVALALSGLSDFVEVYYRNVLYTSTTGSNPFAGGLANIRASSHARDYHYGKDAISDKDLQKVPVPGNMTFVHLEDPTCCGVCCPSTSDKEIPGGYMYRMIGPGYQMTDPLQGKYGWVWRAIPAGPNNDTTTSWNLAGIVHWNDWKPITGENVWALILAPMQTLFIKNCSHIPPFTTYEDAPHEVQLALSVLPACKALLSPLGSLYHCPAGTGMFPPDPDEKTNVSNENNFSAYGAFMALDFVLEYFYQGSDELLDKAKKDTKEIVEGLVKWFKTNLLPGNMEANVISQGGHVTFEGVYHPQDGKQSFAVDCQTWGLLTMGVNLFEGAYGNGMAYNIWQDTKRLAGYVQDGKLAGVGYTNHNTMENKTSIWSGEWTWGAVFMLKRVALEYEQKGDIGHANEMRLEAKQMIEAMGQPVVPDEDGVWKSGGLTQVDGSYLYANDRFFIPWGWYSNPIGATSSTGWAVFNTFDYNPFLLGGGAESTFYEQQCKGNMPDQYLLDNLAKHYGYTQVHK
eukprot:TRINITY_DN1044_c0_g1_i1.p1 TRINITY_DN1044_c0_g1~~TRINITY_DN1044_c0_g1_i1.p1  ORF type:complete len:684 (-),score=174.24 TRINITY_DN1044_c0_g1_i1:38-2089(-)